MCLLDHPLQMLVANAPLGSGFIWHKFITYTLLPPSHRDVFIDVYSPYIFTMLHRMRRCVHTLVFPHVYLLGRINTSAFGERVVSLRYILSLTGASLAVPRTACVHHLK